MIRELNNYLSTRTYLLAGCIFILTAVTFGLTLLPVDRMMPSKLWSYDKLGHLGLFGIWTFLVGYYRYLLKPDGLNLFMIFFIGVLFGVGIELLQYSMPFNRSADFFDVAFDALGCFIAVMVLYKIKESGFGGTK